MSTNDGGPAFPVSTRPCDDDHGYGHQDGAGTWQFSGMSLRDWLAGQAEGPNEHLSSEYVAEAIGIEPPKNLSEREWFLWWRRADALWKYAAADAMLAVREKGEGDAR